MIVIVDYGVGNLTSIKNMLKKSGATAIISSRSIDILSATKLMLPGMGNFDNCMQKFNQSGLRDFVEMKVFQEKVPLLGICVGLQMLMEGSEEGVMPGLGWIKGSTIRFKKSLMNDFQKIPNMGWLDIIPEKPSKLLEELNGSRFYFAHSFHVEPSNFNDIIISADYGYKFVAGLEKDNIIGVQFHPEKSHRFGLKLLGNFAKKY